MANQAKLSSEIIAAIQYNDMATISQLIASGALEQDQITNILQIMQSQQKRGENDEVKIVKFMRDELLKGTSRKKIAEQLGLKGWCKASTAGHILSFEKYIKEWSKQDHEDYLSSK